MVTVKVKLVNGSVEIFETNSYVVSPIKDMHPDILDVKVYIDTKLTKHVHRKLQWFYKKFLYKPIQQELKSETVDISDDK